MSKKQVPASVGVFTIAISLVTFAVVLLSAITSFPETLNPFSEVKRQEQQKEEERYTSSYEKLTEEEVLSLKNDSNLFAFNFYKQLTEEENIFFSPYSIFTAFSMVYEGADGDTATQIRDTFNFSEDDRLRRMGSRQIHE